MFSLNVWLLLALLIWLLTFTWRQKNFVSLLFFSATKTGIMEEIFQIPFANTERSFDILLNCIPMEVCTVKVLCWCPYNHHQEPGRDHLWKVSEIPRTLLSPPNPDALINMHKVCTHFPGSYITLAAPCEFFPPL